MLSTAQPGARGRRRLLTFLLPSMYGLNQTEPATFSFLSCWATFKVPIYVILASQQRCLCSVAAVKSLPVHAIRAVIFPIFKDRAARYLCRVSGTFGLFSYYFRPGWFQYPSFLAMGSV